MVLIEKRLKYLSKINTESKLKLIAFYSMLKVNPVIYDEDRALSEADEIYYGVINSIISNNESDFLHYYKIRSRSKPSDKFSSPFVSDDFLIFSLLIGIVKFGVARDWINSILSIKSKNEITETFQNIIKEDYFSLSNIPEIVLCFLSLTNKSLINNDLTNRAYLKIKDDFKLFDNQNDFKILCTLNAYDIIIDLKEIPRGSRISLLEKFDKKFNKRITVVFLIIQVVFFYGIISLLISLPNYNPKVIDLIEKYNYVFTFFSALGLSLIGNQVAIYKDKIKELIKMALGYPKELIGKE